MKLIILIKEKRETDKIQTRTELVNNLASM